MKTYSGKVFFFNWNIRWLLPLSLYKEKVEKILNSVYNINYKETKSIITEPDFSKAPIWKDNQPGFGNKQDKRKFKKKKGGV